MKALFRKSGILCTGLLMLSILIVPTTIYASTEINQ